MRRTQSVPALALLTLVVLSGCRAPESVTVFCAASSATLSTLR